MSATEKVYSVKAKRWSGGWELHVADVGVTQSRTLGKATEAARDFIATIYDIEDTSGIKLDLLVHLGDGLDYRVRRVSDLKAEVALRQAEAARESRETARALVEAGLSTTDAADVLGISKGRVSQLIGGRTRKSTAVR